MPRRPKGEKPFDSEFRVPCYAADLKRWRRNAKALGVPITEAARQALELRFGTPRRKAKPSRVVAIREVDWSGQPTAMLRKVSDQAVADSVAERISEIDAARAASRESFDALTRTETLDGEDPVDAYRKLIEDRASDRVLRFRNGSVATLTGDPVERFTGAGEDPED